MTTFIVQNEGVAARRRVQFSCNSDVDGSTQAGLTFSGSELQVAKNSPTYANAANIGTVSGGGAGAQGVYEYEFGPAEVDTFGYLNLKLNKVGTIPRVFSFQVVAFNLYDPVRGGLTALPAANAEAAGGLFTRGTGPGQINQDTNGRLDTRTVSMVASTVTAAAIATDAVNEIADQVWDEALSGHLSAGSTGLALFLSKGLSQCNYVLDQTSFGGDGMMIEGRIRIFADAAGASAATQGGSGQGEIASFSVSASGSTPGQLQLYKVVQQ